MTRFEVTVAGSPETGLPASFGIYDTVRKDYVRFYQAASCGPIATSIAEMMAEDLAEELEAMPRDIGLESLLDVLMAEPPQLALR